MNENDNEVGYCKPPKHGQFRKGVSGNPKGRPRGSRNLLSILAQALNKKVVINENGHRRVVSKRAAAMTQLANKAASGDPAALRQLLSISGALDGLSAGSKPEDLSEADKKVMQNFLKRLAGYSKGGNDER